MSEASNKTVPGELEGDAKRVDLFDGGVLAARDEKVIHFNYYHSLLRTRNSSSSSSNSNLLPM